MTAISFLLAAAEKEHDKLVREKVGKGYKEVTASVSKMLVFRAA